VKAVQDADGMILQSFRFDSGGNVTIRVAGVVAVFGRYRIEDSRLYITTSSALLGEIILNYTYEKKEDGIFLNGIEYMKVN
jgi:hypothetical protein